MKLQKHLKKKIQLKKKKKSFLFQNINKNYNSK